MKALLTAAALALVAGILLLAPKPGAPALLLCASAAAVAGYFISRQGGADKKFLLRLFAGALLVRVAVGTAIFYFQLQEFFGGDAYTYDVLGSMQLEAWQTGSSALVGRFGEYALGWGMAYLVAAIYYLVGPNMLAVQYVNAVAGAATAPLIYLCAHRIFRNVGVARSSALFVAFYPSLVLWSSQGLKDGPIVFLLALSMLATLRLDEKFSPKWGLVLLGATFAVFSMRFYVFYMMVAAIGGSFLIGMKTVASQGKARQFAIVIALAAAMMYLGVLRSAGAALERYGSLETVQQSRADLAGSASGFGRESDVSTAGGALSTIPVGMVYLLFAPFPWQLASLRQSITLPEMVVWWGSFPLLAAGLWFTLRHRMRQALPILVFTMMLTLAYSVFQGNVGTAYRQRSQLLVFYFIFVAVGYVLMKERREDRRRQIELDKLRIRQKALLGAARRKQEREWETIADSLSEKVGF
jgi:4-amino-4-deoxy-L-arabinose transferase-like glycosyltransferase